MDTTTVVFPKDAKFVMATAFRSGADHALHTYPDVFRDSADLCKAAFAHAFPPFSKMFLTEEPELLEAFFMNSYTEGYSAAWQFFDWSPKAYDELMGVPEKAQLYWGQEFFDAWYQVYGKKTKRWVLRREYKG